jgi:cephalosporin-C deacetylase-like acetyl esterase
MVAWAFGVSRILDVLETLPGANINTKKIAVTGCSRNGKGALVAGALDSRIALTIPQESGSGGTACWRLSDY